MRLVFDVVHNLAVPVLLGTLYIDKSVKGIFPPERNIATYNSKPVPVLAIIVMPEDFKNEHKNRLQDVSVMEEDVSLLVCMAR